MEMSLNLGLLATMRGVDGGSGLARSVLAWSDGGQKDGYLMDVATCNGDFSWALFDMDGCRRWWFPII